MVPSVSALWDSAAPSVSPQAPTAPPVSPRWDMMALPVSPSRDPTVTPVSPPRDPAASPVFPPRAPAASPVSPLLGLAAPTEFRVCVLVMPAVAPAPAPTRRAAEHFFSDRFIVTRLHVEVFIANTAAAGHVKPVNPLACRLYSHHLSRCSGQRQSFFVRQPQRCPLIRCPSHTCCGK